MKIRMAGTIAHSRIAENGQTFHHSGNNGTAFFIGRVGQLRQFRNTSVGIRILARFVHSGYEQIVHGVSQRHHLVPGATAFLHFLGHRYLAGGNPIQNHGQ